MYRKLSVLCLGLVALWSASCGSSNPGESVQSNTSALTADQCNYFDVNGKTRICHATGSAKNPYVAIDVSSNACVSAHSQHPGDYVASGDPTCNGSGCLPAGAPWDANVNMNCCPGLTVQNGLCSSASNCPPELEDCGGGCCAPFGNCGACGT